MRGKPVALFSVVAAMLVLWFMVRMWFGASPSVWAVSCLLGAWSPIFGAMVFAYVRAVSQKEDSVFVAWLVRAIGMHTVLLWMLGVSDALRGPPGSPPRWNSDAGAPLVLLLLVPVFLLTYGAVEWLRSVSLRVERGVARPAMPGERERVAAFRELPVVFERALDSGRRAALLIVTALSVLLALWAPMQLPFTLCATALACAMLTRRARGSVLSSVLSLSLVSLAGLGALVSEASLSRGYALALWPWATLAPSVLYLCALVLSLRAPRAASRA